MESPAPHSLMPDKVESRPSRAAATIVPFLLENSPAYRLLHELRQEGWKNEEGDRFFAEQRRRADGADEHARVHFFEMMKAIGHELQSETCAFSIAESSPSSVPTILDFCAAPGGFLATALDLNPTAQATAFSLPEESGGHRFLLNEKARVHIDFLDINLLAEDMEMQNIPASHEEYGSFLPRKIPETEKFDLVLCDGQVLRTHQRLEYRERREARRLTVTQLALGLEHLKPGGTMIVLLHKVESWDTVRLLKTFKAFSTVRLFKPRRYHAKRSSFYMVAQNVNSQTMAAQEAVCMWKKIWNAATLDQMELFESLVREDNQEVSKLLEEFGRELVEMGEAIWTTQARALAKAPFIRNR